MTLHEQRVKVSIIVDEEVKKILKQVARKDNRTVSNLIETLLNKYIDELVREGIVNRSREI